MKRQIKNIKEDIQGGVYYDTSIPYNSGEDRSRREQMDDSRFFKIVQGIVKYLNYDKLMEQIEPDELWERVKLIKNITKLYGMGGKDEVIDSDGLIHAMFWAAIENYDLIKDGTITNFSQLEVRPLKSYEVKMFATEDEYVDYNWTVTAQGYDKSDVLSEVQVNEDGLYDWWEWENKPGFSREVAESERREWEAQGIKEVSGTKGKLSEHWWEEETTDKWGLLEKDMREAMDKIIEDHKSNWGGDQYNVMGAIEEIMENLFQKVSIRESFMSDPKVAKYFENKDILKYLKGKDRELVSDAVEMLRGWGRFNPIMTDLSPFLTDATENLKGEYAADILKWATENESFPPDYDQFFEELDREEVSWLWENGQDVRDALTRSAILLADDTDGGESMDVLNKIFKEFARKTYRFILTGDWLEDAQQRRNSEPMTDEDAMEGIMMDVPDDLMEQYEEGENQEGKKWKLWVSDYADVETDNREDYLTQVLERFYSDVIYDEKKWERDGHNDDLIFLLTQESQNMIEDLEMNQEHKTADKIEKILSPLWDFEDERRDILDKHRKILISAIQGIKDFVKIYGIGPDRFSNKNYR
jgi:hypothetical protein